MNLFGEDVHCFSYNDAANNRLFLIVVILMTIYNFYEFIEIFMRRFPFIIIIESLEFHVLSGRNPIRRKSFEIVLALLFFFIASYLPLFYIIYPLIWNQVFPSDKQDIYRNDWLFLDIIDQTFCKLFFRYTDR